MSETAHTPTPGWGHTAGMVSIGTTAFLHDSAQSLLDRANIIQAVNRYGWAYDERQLDALAAGFTTDAIWDGNVGGTFVIEPLIGRDTIVQWLKGFMDEQVEQRRHILLNHVVTRQTQTEAEVLTYVLITSASHGSAGVVTTGFYRFELRADHPGGAWLIAHVFGGFDAPF